MFKRKLASIISLIGVFLFAPFHSVFANDTVTTDVNVMPNLDQNLQIEGESYFNYDLKNFIGQDMNASFYIRNLNSEAIEVQMEAANGLTGSGGTVVYEASGKTKTSGFNDETYKVSELITDLPESISMKAGETKEVPFMLRVPENAKGQYVGVIRFTKVNDNGDEENAEGVSIQLKTAYSMGLWFKVSDEEMVDLGIEELKVDLEGANPTLLLRLNNENPHFLKEQQLEYEVIRLKDEREIFSGSQKVALIAPKNYYWNPIAWENELKPGKYLLRVNGEEFEFEIENKDMQVIEIDDKNTVIIENNSIPWWMWVLLGGFALIILFLLWKKRKESKETKDTEKENAEEKKEVEEEKEKQNEESKDDEDTLDETASEEKEENEGDK